MTSFIEFIEKGNLIPYLIYTSYFVYTVVFLGLFFINSYYVDILKVLTQTYIAVTLIYYFNPFSSVTTITPNIRKVIFSSAFILLLNNSNTIKQIIYNFI